MGWASSHCQSSAVSAPPIAEIAVDAVFRDDDGALSAAGTVTSGRLQGTRAAVGPIFACGECPTCRRGGAAVCPARSHLRAEDGQTASVPERWLIPLTGVLDLPPRVAAIAVGPWTRAYAMYAEAGLGPREPAVVIGDDHIAHAIVGILVAKSIRPAVVTRLGSTVAARAQAAELSVVDDTRSNVADAIATAARSESVATGPRPLAVLITSTSEHRRAIAMSVASEPRTTVVIHHREGARDLVIPAAAMAAETRVICVQYAHPDLAHEVLALVARGDLPQSTS